MIVLRNDWTGDVNKADIIEWVKESLQAVDTDDFGEARIEIIIFRRKWVK